MQAPYTIQGSGPEDDYHSVHKKTTMVCRKDYHDPDERSECKGAL